MQKLSAVCGGDAVAQQQLVGGAQARRFNIGDTDRLP